MRTKCREAFEPLADLLWHYGRKPLHYIWVAQNRWPKLFGWFWRMIHRLEWQKSTAQSIAFWVAATPVVFHVARQLGNGVAASVSVSLAVDWLAFVINKLWIWRKRNAGMPRSAGKNLAFWVFTAGTNFLLAWLVISRVGIVQGRVVLGGYGFLMNPVMFTVRDRIVFADGNVRERAVALYRQEMAKVVASGHAMWMRTRV